MPTVSVLMSVYKEPLEWVKQSIDSILHQSYSDFEFIIINDKPDRAELAEFLENEMRIDTRIKLHTNPQNIGLTKSLNNGLKFCTGKYIARMDADDISLPGRLEKQVEFLDANPLIGVCGTFIETFGQIEDVKKYPLTHEDCFLFFDSPFAHPCVMIRRDILENNIICYNPTVKYAQDFDLWERLYPLTQFANIPEVLLRYRVSEVQVSTAKAGEQYGVSTEIKRRALNQYCILHGIDFTLSTPVDLTQIKGYKRSVPKSVRFDRNRLLSYLYRSVKTNRFKALIYLVVSGDFAKFKLIDSAKTFFTLAFLPNKAPLLS